MKKFAFYLPQFHCIPENDMWWGKGFTEWVNVKKARPLYKGHLQPKKPLNQNYYNLLEPETLIWQSKLINEYRLDGLIYYHYYFEGKKLLEKPAEMLLTSKDVPINFFFCWANHSWLKSWEGSKEVLIAQTYGGEKEWEAHFQYLLPFFRDGRYEKYQNKPVFMLFACDFEKKNEMLAYFDRRCKSYGFSGICVIETLESYHEKKIMKFDSQKSIYTEFVFLREPVSSLRAFSSSSIMPRIKNRLGKIACKYLKYPYIAKRNGNDLFHIMSCWKTNRTDIIRGLFFEWDNTPRHNYRGYVITPPTKENFLKYIDTVKNSEYLFINAWNEWCEGMILEPTEENGFKYLEWIKEIDTKK